MSPLIASIFSCQTYQKSVAPRVSNRNYIRILYLPVQLIFVSFPVTFENCRWPKNNDFNRGELFSWVNFWTVSQNIKHHNLIYKKRVSVCVFPYCVDKLYTLGAFCVSLGKVIHTPGKCGCLYVVMLVVRFSESGWTQLLFACVCQCEIIHFHVRGASSWVLGEIFAMRVEQFLDWVSAGGVKFEGSLNRWAFKLEILASKNDFVIYWFVYLKRKLYLMVGVLAKA